MNAGFLLQIFIEGDLCRLALGNWFARRCTEVREYGMETMICVFRGLLGFFRFFAFFSAFFRLFFAFFFTFSRFFCFFLFKFHYFHYFFLTSVSNPPHRYQKLN